MRSILIILLLFFVNNIFGQTITKKQFKNTRWIGDNRNPSFYEKDTFFLYQIPENIDYNNSEGFHSNPIDIVKLFGHGHSVEITFKKKMDLAITEWNNDEEGLHPINDWFWKYNSRVKKIQFYRKTQLKETFLIIDQFKREVPIRIANQPPTVEVMGLQLVRTY